MTTYNIMDSGALSDLAVCNTLAIQQAIDAGYNSRCGTDRFATGWKGFPLPATHGIWRILY